MQKTEFRITDSDDGTRLDRFIRRHFEGINQGRVEKLLRMGDIRVDGSRAKSNTRLMAGQVITMPEKLRVESSRPKPPPAAPDPALVETLRRCVITWQPGLIALDKPAGLAVQGGSGTTRHIAGALAAAFPDSIEPPRLVHRLDRDTSGVLVVATSRASARALAMGFKNGAHRKIYLALVAGVPDMREGLIDAPLQKSGGKMITEGGVAAGIAKQSREPQKKIRNEKMQVGGDDGLPAQTLYSVLECFGNIASLLALRPLTGRTHQLRAHMAHIGHPILGDGKYGFDKTKLPSAPIKRLCLHAAHLTPENHAPIAAPIPPDLAAIMDIFGADMAAAMRTVADENLLGDAT